MFAITNVTIVRSSGAVTQAPPISRAPPPSHSIDHHSQSGQSQQHPSQQQQQPLAFTFPSPEEMALQQQRFMALIQSGAIQVSEPFAGAPAGAMFQPGVYSVGSLAAAAQLHPGHALEAISHMRPEEQPAAIMAVQQAAVAQQQAQAAQSQGLIPGVLPPAFMEQLLAQQQQQQAMANAVAVAAAGGLPGTGVIPTTPDGNILEIQRQYEALVLAVQKNPVIAAQNPQISLAIDRYQRILHEHHIQQQRMHEAMIQNSQQHELHKHLLLARVPAGATPSESASARGIRTGVIVHPN